VVDFEELLDERVERQNYGDKLQGSEVEGWLEKALKYRFIKGLKQEAKWEACHDKRVGFTQLCQVEKTLWFFQKKAHQEAK
jgi:hypothetical protein